MREASARQKTRNQFNVTGTMNVFEAAHRAGVTQVVYLSSTSVRNHASLYGHTKVLGEEIAQGVTGIPRMTAT